MRKLKYIDALRGIAIIGVVIVHSSQYDVGKYPAFISRLLDFGKFGVQLFFIASALTLFISLNNRKESGTGSYGSFMIRRYFRIAPMYYLGIAYYLFQEGFGPRYWLGSESHITTANVVSNALFIHGFNPYYANSIVPGGWTMAVEMLFYLFVPLLFKYISNINDAIVFFILSVIIRIITLFIFHHINFPDAELWKEFEYINLPVQLPVFACGFILYFMIFQTDFAVNIKPWNKLLITVFAGSAIFGILTHNSYFFSAHLLLAIAFIFFAYMLSVKQFTLFVNPVICGIGKISFSLYLVHFAILHWLHQLGLIDILPVTGTFAGLINFVIRLMIVLICGGGIAFFFYKVVEIPFQKIGSKIVQYLSSVK